VNRRTANIEIALVLGSLMMLAVSCSTPHYVGSRDCAELVAELNIPAFSQACERCQGTACDADAECKRDFPCQDGKIVVQGCEDDSDCSALGAQCARYTAHPHNICSILSDDI
jgi:hypothetical protein